MTAIYEFKQEQCDELFEQLIPLLQVQNNMMGFPATDRVRNDLEVGEFMLMHAEEGNDENSINGIKLVGFKHRYTRKYVYMIACGMHNNQSLWGLKMPVGANF